MAGGFPDCPWRWDFQKRTSGFSPVRTRSSSTSRPGMWSRCSAVLKLDEKLAYRQTVCFFDTADGALEARGLILRARQKDGGPGESTVKLRAIEGAGELSDAERAIQPEQDWTREDGPTLSRSVDHEAITEGLVARAAAGEGRVIELFNDQQQKLVMARMKDFNWESLRRYGPVEAKVWKQQRKLEGFRGKGHHRDLESGKRRAHAESARSLRQREGRDRRAGAGSRSTVFRSRQGRGTGRAFGPDENPPGAGVFQTGALRDRPAFQLDIPGGEVSDSLK